MTALYCAQPCEKITKLILDDPRIDINRFNQVNNFIYFIKIKTKKQSKDK